MRNGGQIIAGLKHDPDKLEAAFGVDLGAAITAEFNASADLVFSLIDRYDMNCHDQRNGWIQGAHGRKGFEELVSPRFRQWKARGVDVRLLDRAQAAALDRLEQRCVLRRLARSARRGSRSPMRVDWRRS